MPQFYWVCQGGEGFFEPNSPQIHPQFTLSKRKKWLGHEKLSRLYLRRGQNE